HATGLAANHFLVAIRTSAPNDERHILRRIKTSLRVIKSSQTGFYTAQDVAFIVWSNGPNGDDEVISSESSGVTTYTIPYPVERSGISVDDDVAGWATLSELKAAAGCGSDLTISFTSLPAGQTGSAYAGATFTPRTNIVSPTYSWCVEFVDPTGVLAFTADAAAVTPQADCTAVAATYTDGATLVLGAATLPVAAACTTCIGAHDLRIFLRARNAAGTNLASTDRRVTYYINLGS
ncbi:MAG: hypothetical protein H7839_23635, partial [Magnetococcus sp. YQC-5]